MEHNPTPMTIADDTICAISTPPGVGGIAVIRISGSEAIKTADRLWRGKPLAKAATHTCHLGDIVDPTNGQQLDQAVATVFRAPKSFTGEDVVEFSVHGSKWIQTELMRLLVDNGCRIARAGEFTRRAFASGKLDLAEAEAVADVIAATSRSAHRLAASQMRGDFSRVLESLRNQLLELASLLELELDFSEEEVEFASREKLLTLACEIQTLVNRLAASFATGQAIKDGIPVAIVGEPNAGKSTLLNHLLSDNRAIVSDIPGTTRDTIEDTIQLDGTTYRFIDTAGLRDNPADEIEALGIDRTISKIRNARIVLWLIAPDTPDDTLLSLNRDITANITPGASVLIIINKIDKTPVSDTDVKRILKLTGSDTEPLRISARTGEGIDRLTATIRENADLESAGTTDVIVTNSRHYEALHAASESISRVIAGLKTGLSGDFIAQDLRETIHHLGTITGTITTPEILQTIFSKFCIGK